MTASGRSARSIASTILRFVLPALLAGCGYFNTMYNANRHFGEAERLRARGDGEAAAREYGLALDGAAASLHGHPDGRWADDALHVIGRSRFFLGGRAAAREAFATLLASSDEPRFLANGRAGIGAIDVAAGQTRAGLARLDSALRQPAGFDRDFAMLWRARARFALGMRDSAWSDLDRAAAGTSALAADASLEAATQALVAADTTRFRNAMRRLYADPRAAALADTCLTLIGLMAIHAGPSFGRSVTASIDDAAWSADAAAAHRLESARFAAATGDTAAAVSEAMALARSQRGEPGERALRLAARLELARAERADLPRIRSMLLSGAAGRTDLVQAMDIIAILMEEADRGASPPGLFAAAELARDELAAHRLARQLFLEYATAEPDAVWAPKALLAALQLEADSALAREIIGRFHAAPRNVYVQAVMARPDPDEFAAAEGRLARTLAAVLESARHEAARRAAIATRDTAHGVDGPRSLRGATKGTITRGNR